MANWLSGYTTRRKITIDYTKIDSTLTDFPVLVKLTSSNFDFSKANSDGYDIRFTSSDGTTLLKYERERHDATNKLAEYWVKIPSISSTANTEFFVYFRVEDTADGADPTNTWESGFKGVWHMKDLTTSTIEDSTSNNNDGTKASANNPLEVDGIIGKGQDFSSDIIDCNSSTSGSSLDITSEITIEAWIKPDTISTYQTICARRIGANNQPTQYGIILSNSGKLMLEGGITGGAWWSPGEGVSTISTTAWTYVVVTWKNSNTSYNYYVNGSSDKSGTYASHAITSSAIPVTIGKNSSGGDNAYPEPFDGKIDEVRISNTVRTAAWIKASYNSGNNSLVSYGNEEKIMMGGAFLLNFT